MSGKFLVGDILRTIAPIALLALTGICLAAIGPNDPCPTPTPYPPVTAGAGAIHNPSFEGGFTSGVANQWVAFKHRNWTNTQVHFDATDRKQDGSYAQQLILPQPQENDQSAGVYQQLWVVPGQDYTVTTKVYLEFPSSPGNGVDLVAWLGLDPFGAPGGSGGGMIWHNPNASGTRNQWLTLSVTVKSVFPVMTVSLRATRKWPQSGSGAKVWFDQVVLTGPIPTGERPGPGPDPTDPETLIPSTDGPNLIINPSFEEPFVNGLAASWNKWFKTGIGTWKSSTRVGKVGGGKYDCGGEAEIIAMNCKTALFYGGDPEKGYDGTYGTAQGWINHPHMENSIVIGRPAVDDRMGTYRTNPSYYGARLADQLQKEQQQWPRIDCWQGLNEPGWDTDWQWVIEFEKAFVDRLHYWGMKSCSLNLSTGSPGNYWRMIDETFAPDARELMAVADYLGHHCYGGPDVGLMVTYNQTSDKSSPCDFSLRPRRFWDMYNRRGWRFPPVIATEGSTYFPWHGNFTPAQIGNDLMMMGTYMNADRWWCGYTNFVVGAQCSWTGFEICGQGTIVQDVGTWNANNPADAMHGLYSQMFGAGKVHPYTVAEMVPAGLFDGGVNQLVNGLTPGIDHLVTAWIKYEFRGYQPTQLKFYLGVDLTGQTSNGNAATIDWGEDQIATKAPVHEIFSHAWRTFRPISSSASIWLRASHPTANPSFMFYVDQVEVRRLALPPGPVIELSTTQISVSTNVGTNPPNASLTIRNAGVGTMSYTLGANVPWLSLQPAGGSSTGEADSISVIFNTSGIPGTAHSGIITVASPEAINSPQTITVQVAVTTVRPDFDFDGDVDQTDFGHFQTCVSGSGFPQLAAECQNARLDNDEDVDQDDSGIFQRCMSGPGIPANPQCAG